MKRKIALYFSVLLLVAGVMVSYNEASAKQYQYGKKATMTGVLKQIKNPDTYSNVKKIYVLKFSSPISFIGQRDRKEKRTQLQVVLKKKSYYKKHKNKRVTITGKLTAGDYDYYLLQK